MAGVHSTVITIDAVHGPALCIAQAGAVPIELALQRKREACRDAGARPLAVERRVGAGFDAIELVPCRANLGPIALWDVAAEAVTGSKIGAVVDLAILCLIAELIAAEHGHRGSVDGGSVLEPSGGAAAGQE
jgi:hypothetical protein